MPSARITGGTLAGRSIRVPARSIRGFRPTSSRLREALFSILGDRVRDARFLDLYAGAGLAGFEALSRGAAQAVFVEASRPLARSIEEHAADLGVASAAVVVCGRLPAALRRINGLFDIVFLDPPYDEAGAIATLSSLRHLCSPNALVVYEHASRYNPPERPFGLRLVDRRTYGDSAIGLYETTEIP